MKNTARIQTSLATVLVFWLMFPSTTCGFQTHDFSTNPITWNPLTGPLSWDSDNDAIDDFQVSVVSGSTDLATGRFAIDNFSTSNGGSVREFLFAFRPLRSGFDSAEINLLGFDFYSEKNIEPGGSGGAGSILADVFDDTNLELLNGVNVSGNLGSNPSHVDLPGMSQSFSFSLVVDVDSPPKNDDAQIILGDFVFNGGSVRAFSSVPEPGTALLLLAVAGLLSLKRTKTCVA